MLVKAKENEKVQKEAGERHQNLKAWLPGYGTNYYRKNYCNG